MTYISVNDGQSDSSFDVAHGSKRNDQGFVVAIRAFPIYFFLVWTSPLRRELALKDHISFKIWYRVKDTSTGF